MLVTINAVNIEKTTATVNFTRDGKSETRKIMSWAVPKTYDKLAGYKEFPFDANIIMVKNDKTGYWDWVDIEVQQKGANIESTKPVGKVIGSNYETPQERARKQVYIVRQSSISSAIEMAKAREPKGTTKTVEEILKDASRFEEFVMTLDSFDSEVFDSRGGEVPK